MGNARTLVDDTSVGHYHFLEKGMDHAASATPLTASWNYESTWEDFHAGIDFDKCKLWRSDGNSGLCIVFPLMAAVLGTRCW